MSKQSYVVFQLEETGKLSFSTLMEKIFGSKEIFLRLINCSFCWLACTFNQIIHTCFYNKNFFNVFYFYFCIECLSTRFYTFIHRTTITLVYYGLSITSVELSGNKYLNFMLVNAVEVPAFLTSWYFMEHFPRRNTQAFSFLFSGIGCIMVNLIPMGKQILLFYFCFWILVHPLSNLLLPIRHKLSVNVYICIYTVLWLLLLKIVHPTTVLTKIWIILVIR